MFIVYTLLVIIQTRSTDSRRFQIGTTTIPVTPSQGHLLKVMVDHKNMVKYLLIILEFLDLGYGWAPFVDNDELDGLGYLTRLRAIPNRRCWIGGSSNITNSESISILHDYRSDGLGNIANFLVNFIQNCVFLSNLIELILMYIRVSHLEPYSVRSTNIV